MLAAAALLVAGAQAVSAHDPPVLTTLSDLAVMHEQFSSSSNPFFLCARVGAPSGGVPGRGRLAHVVLEHSLPIEGERWRGAARAPGAQRRLQGSRPSIHSPCKLRMSPRVSLQPSSQLSLIILSFQLPPWACMQVGVGIFVDNSEGAFLQTASPMEGGEMCSLLPGSGGPLSCVMDPAAASASAAAFLHAMPVAHVDAEASSKVGVTRVLLPFFCYSLFTPPTLVANSSTPVSLARSLSLFQAFTRAHRHARTVIDNPFPPSLPLSPVPFSPSSPS